MQSPAEMQSGIRLPSRAGQAQSNLPLVPPPERIQRFVEMILMPYLKIVKKLAVYVFTNNPGAGFFSGRVFLFEVGCRVLMTTH
jgi:hypothetical protein